MRKERIIRPETVSEAKRRSTIWGEPIYIGTFAANHAVKMSYSDTNQTSQRSHIMKAGKPWPDPREWVVLAVVEGDTVIVNQNVHVCECNPVCSGVHRYIK